MARAHEHAVAVATTRVRTERAFRLTDLRCTHFDSVESRFFRLFTPVKPERNRLPTTLPEFAAYKYAANLSDSPLTASHKLGGSWRDHNLAAITHLAACNLRCGYCYVDRPHLAGRDSFEADPAQIAGDFEALHERTGVTILRVSGGEPLLAPDLPARLVELLASSRHPRCAMVKVESNMTTLTPAFNGLPPGARRLVEATAGRITLHATIHGRPGTGTYRQTIPGIRLAVDLGYDLYPAIPG